jgi:transcriptional regulator with XRE-family HTH domain
MPRCDVIRSRIGDRVREYRRALGMTQDQCAALIGISRLSFTRIELGHRRIKLPELAAICEALGCSAADLLGDATLAVAAARNHDRLYGSLPIFTNTP